MKNTYQPNTLGGNGLSTVGVTNSLYSTPLRDASQNTKFSLIGSSMISSNNPNSLNNPLGGQLQNNYGGNIGGSSVPTYQANFSSNLT